MVKELKFGVKYVKTPELVALGSNIKVRTTYSFM